MRIRNIPLGEIEAYAATVTGDVFKREDLYDEIREQLERIGICDPERLDEILGDGEHSQSIRDFAEERGMDSRYK